MRVRALLMRGVPCVESGSYSTTAGLWRERLGSQVSKFGHVPVQAFHAAHQRRQVAGDDEDAGLGHGLSGSISCCASRLPLSVRR